MYMIFNFFKAKKKQRTVFDRLGESSVSSTTSDISIISTGSKSSGANGMVSKETVKYLS